MWLLVEIENDGLFLSAKPKHPELNTSQKMANGLALLALKDWTKRRRYLGSLSSFTFMCHCGRVVSSMLRSFRSAATHLRLHTHVSRQPLFDQPLFPDIPIALWEQAHLILRPCPYELDEILYASS